jgi:hypothetical protein
MTQGGFSHSSQPPEKSGFVPDPQSAVFVFANTDWIAWETQILIRSTRRHRAQSHTYRYYLQKEIGAGANLVPYQERSTRGSAPVWAFPDGTMVLSGYRTIIFVGPESQSATKVSLEDVRFRENATWSVYARLAGKAGLVMQTANLNEREPLYLVPWTKDRAGLDFDQKLLLTDSTGISVSAPYNLLAWHGQKIVSFRPPALLVFDLATKKLTTAELQSHRKDRKSPWWGAEILGFDGDVVILRNGAEVFGYRLASKKQFPVFRKSKGEIAGYGQNQLYVIQARDDSYESGSYLFDLIRIDITTRSRELLIPDLGRSKFDGQELIQAIPTRDKLHIWVHKSRRWTSFSWQNR